MKGHLKKIYKHSLKDPLACTYVKIPDSPIPSSWAKQITPLENFTVQYKYSTPFPKNGNLETTVLLLQEKKLQSSSYYEVDSILDFNLRSFKKKFEVVLIDPPYDRVKPEQMVSVWFSPRCDNKVEY